MTKDDLELMVRDILKLLNKDNGVEAYAILAPIRWGFVSSIASGMNDELAKISYELRHQPIGSDHRDSQH